MMNNSDLPPDLAELEQELYAAGHEPAPTLRDQVMARVRRELRCSKRLDFWQYASTVAATFLLVLNLSFSAAFASFRALRLDHNQVTTLCKQIGQMQLGLSADEINRQCLLMLAGGKLLPYERPYGSAPVTSSAIVFDN